MEKKLYFLKKTCGRKFLEEFIVSWKYRSQPMRNFYDNLPVLTPAFNTFNYWCFKPWCREGFHLSLCRRELSPHLLLVAGTHCCSAAPWALPKFHFSHPPTALKMTKHKKKQSENNNSNQTCEKSGGDSWKIINNCRLVLLCLTECGRRDLLGEAKD